MKETQVQSLIREDPTCPQSNRAHTTAVEPAALGAPRPAPAEPASLDSLIQLALEPLPCSEEAYRAATAGE